MCFLFNSAFAQLDTINYHPTAYLSKVETTTITKYYKDNNLKKTTVKPKKTKHKTEKKEIPETQYDKAIDNNNSIDNCKPCWLRYFNDNGKMIQEGLSYLDCALGKRIEYYPSGKTKVVMFFKTNDTNEWGSFPCSVADGIWTYYSEIGVIEKTVSYKDGKEIIK